MRRRAKRGTYVLSELHLHDSSKFRFQDSCRNTRRERSRNLFTNSLNSPPAGVRATGGSPEEGVEAGGEEVVLHPLGGVGAALLVYFLSFLFLLRTLHILRIFVCVINACGSVSKTILRITHDCFPLVEQVGPSPLATSEHPRRLQLRPSDKISAL